MSSPICIAVFGGSFNPPHIGHAMVIQWLLWSGKVDRVMLVPSGGHPFGKPMLPLGDRAAMLRAMSKDIKQYGSHPNQVTVNLIEEELPKPVYTYDLLTHLRGELDPEMFKLFFVIGADILDEAPMWHKWDQIRDEAGLIVLGREGYPSPQGSPTIPEFSSSEVRRLIAAGDDQWKAMVTPGVRLLLPGPYSRVGG